MQASRVALDFGLATALVAAPFGYVDFRGIDRGTRAKRVGIMHAISNLTMVGLFAASRLLRSPRSTPSAARWLSGAGLLISAVGAWLGGELVARHAIGVHDVVGQNVPSSLHKTPLEQTSAWP